MGYLVGSKDQKNCENIIERLTEIRIQAKIKTNSNFTKILTLYGISSISRNPKAERSKKESTLTTQDYLSTESCISKYAMFRRESQMLLDTMLQFWSLMLFDHALI